MTRSASRALWRAAPFRLLRTPGWLLLLVVATTLLVASVVAPVLFVATARSSALDTGLQASAGNPYGEESADLRVVWDNVVDPSVEPILLDRLRALPAYDDPDVTASGTRQSRTLRAVAVANGVQEQSVIWYHDGVIEALGGDPDEEGVWLAEEVADALGLEVGDPVRIALFQPVFDTTSASPTTLLGTYETAPDSSLPAAAVDLPDSERWFLPFHPDLVSLDSPLAIANRSTFDEIVLDIGEAPLYAADMRLDPDVTPAEAEAAAEEVAALAQEGFDPGSDIARALQSGEPEAARLGVASGLAVIADDAAATAASARDQVRPYAIGGQVLAAFLLAAAWVLLGLSRHREQLLASGLGVRPGELAGLAGLEMLVVALLAVPAGTGLACLGVLLAGPPTEIGLPVSGGDVVRGAVAAAGGVLLVALTAGVTAFGTDRMDRLTRLGRGRRSVPWGVALVAVTAVVAFGVVTVEPGDRSRTPLTMLFPLLVAASVAMLVARSFAWLRARRPGRARAGTPRWLATRRTGPVVREVTALTAVLAVALGLFAYSLSVRRGVEDGIADKTAALQGARTSVEVDDEFRAQDTRVALDAPFAGSTIVWRHAVSVPPAFGSGLLMAIDPRTFGDVADWGGSGRLEEPRSLLPELDVEHRGIPVLLVGDTDLEVGDQGTISFDSVVDIPVLVLGVYEAFPGSESATGAVTVVAGARRLFKVLPPDVDPRRPFAKAGAAGAMVSELWTDRSPRELRRRLDDAEITTDAAVETSERAMTSNGLVASSWAAAYVLALGAVVLALALAAGLVLALRLADRDRVSDVLLRRMGYAARDLARARAWEVGYAVGTAVLASALATAVLVVGPTTIDAVAGIPPLSRPRAGVADGLVLVAVLVVLVVVAWAAGTLLARRRHAAEVLRGGG